MGGHMEVGRGSQEGDRSGGLQRSGWEGPWQMMRLEV